MILCPNTSPLLVLARMDRLDLLGDPALVVVPAAVLEEVRDKLDEAAARVDRLFLSGARTVTVEPPDEVDVLHSLGRGERSVIAWVRARTEPTTAVLDDAAARAEAARHKLRFVGTLGLFLRARANGRIERVSSLVREALRAGLYLDDGTLERAMKSVGEEWRAED